MSRSFVFIAAASTFLAASAMAGTENVKFPEGYADTYVQYSFVNKPNKKRGNTLRKFYINKSALAALGTSGKLPSGTVLVREDWFVKEDAKKVPLKGADGNFIATIKKGVVVSEKRDGWGVDYPASMRNGNWEYAAFRPNGERRAKAPIKRCFGCHLRKKSEDFVFTMKALRAAAKK